MRRLLASASLAGLLAVACAPSLPPLAPPPPGPPPFPLPQPADEWRSRVLPADLQRLLGADEAWLAGLREARRAESARLASLGVLAVERAAVARAAPPPGLYRCRTVKLGGERGLPLVIYDWFRCRIDRTPSGELRLTKLTGSQRQAGRLYPDSDRRLVFLGAVAWSDRETLAPAYGADRERDQVGFFERIGEQRWRLVLPFPRQESVLDLIEFTPEPR